MLENIFYFEQEDIKIYPVKLSKYHLIIYYLLTVFSFGIYNLLNHWRNIKPLYIY